MKGPWVERNRAPTTSILGGSYGPLMPLMMADENCANCAGGVRTYRRYAEDSHLPSIFITWSGTPAAAAVAAPIRKLWPLYLEASTPSARSTALTSFTNRSRVRIEPSWKRNRGPGNDAGRTVRKDRIAAAGQIAWPVRPRNRSTPCPKGSVFDCRRRTRTKLGGYVESRVTSPTAISASPGSRGERAVNSPAQRKPKNPIQQAAHNNRRS